MFLIECKFTRSGVDFSTIDYILSAADALRSTSPGVAVSPVLISNIPPTGVVEEVARESGLQVMLSTAGPDAIAERLASEAAA